MSVLLDGLRRLRGRSALMRIGALALGVAAAALALIVGLESQTPVPEADEPSPQTYVADQFIQVVDDDRTEQNRDAAAAAVDPQFTTDPQVVNDVVADVEEFFQAVSLAYLHEQVRPTPETTTTTTVPETTTTTTTTTLPPSDDGETTTTSSTTTTTSTTTTSTTTTTTTTLPIPTTEDLQMTLADEYAFVSDRTRNAFLEISFLDLETVAESEEPADLLLPELQDAAVLEVVRVYSGDGILQADLSDIRSEVASSPPVLLDRGYPDREVAAQAVADLVAAMLQPNRRFDEAATEQQRELARAAVPDSFVQYVPGQVIVEQGEIVNATQAKAVSDLLSRMRQAPKRAEMLGVVAVVFGLIALYLRRNRPLTWAQPKMLLLFGLLVALAAITTRLVGSFLAEASDPLGYVMPAAAFGYLAGVLFDTRAAVLMSIPVAVFVGVTTADIGLVVYSAAAVLIPLPFLSSAASQRDLRVAIGYTAAVSAILALAVAAFFSEEPIATEAAVFGFGGGLLGGLIGLGVLPYVDNVFGLTTTLTLLDLTDRNHPALRHLEEKAPGTFNHSMLVGTLAGRASRAIGANPLLAEAAAYYHDLGKTEKPHLFIENQFGAANPHNWMQPEESAAVIRNHVIDGMRLAREFRIPADVAVGIRQHHGTSLMRYFYHKALEDKPEGEVDADDFRHVGQKPQSKEVAILMLADAVEAASRSLAYLDNPTADGLRKVVEQVVDEKLEDGQLDESDLTFGDLTKVKAALTDALISHYHHRIVYPNFPGQDRA